VAIVQRRDYDRDLVTQPPEERHAREETGHRQVTWKTILVLVIVVYAVLLIALNSKHVRLDFVFLHADTNLLFLVLLSMAVGALLGWLIPRYLQRRRTNQ
jgi:uncharacterized integral membrane protein